MKTRPRALKPRRRRPKTGARTGRRKPPEPKLVGRPEVIVLGSSPLCNRVARAIKKVGIEGRRVETPEEASAASEEQTKALFIVPPIPEFSVLTYLRRQRSPRVPVFVVLEGMLPPRTVRELYREDVQAIFEWPADAEALERTVFRVAAPSLVRWGRKKKSSEVALEEMVRMRLRAQSTEFGAGLRVEAHRRFVVLKGSVDALWKLELAKRAASEVAGVEDVSGDAVQVEGGATTNRAVARAIREVLRNASAIDASTLAVNVRDGEVTLTGSATDKRELSRAVDLISHIRGVRRIDNYVAISPDGKRQDRTVARRVREVLKSCYPESVFDVSVFGGIAVLSGRVDRAFVRDELTRLVYRQNGVKRVVDKLSVGGG